MNIDLLKKKCIPCEGRVEPLDVKTVASYLSYLKTQWDVSDNKKISYTFAFKNFKEAIAFVQKVADVAEDEGHHPDISIFYNKVRIELWTHAIGGLSENDFILARKIEEIPL
jgi:4a-hydroxytetrahydrobiopterin dehydratase